MCFRLRKLAFLAGFRRLIAVLLVLAYVATTLGFSWSARVFEPALPRTLARLTNVAAVRPNSAGLAAAVSQPASGCPGLRTITSSPPLSLPARWRPMRIMTMLQPQGTRTLQACIRHSAARAANDRRRPATGRRPAGRQSGRQPRPHMASSLPNVREFRPCGSSTARLLRRRFRPPGLSIGPSSTRSRPCAALCPP